MNKFSAAWRLPAALGACTVLAHPWALAQGKPPSSNVQATAAPASPLDVNAKVPGFVHQSAFKDFRRITDEPVGSWRAANETVNRVGGWRAYAREAQSPAAPSPSTQSPSPKAKP